MDAFEFVWVVDLQCQTVKTPGLIYKISENSEKCHKFQIQGDIVSLLVLSKFKTQRHGDRKQRNAGNPHTGEIGVIECLTFWLINNNLKPLTTLWVKADHLYHLSSMKDRSFQHQTLQSVHHNVNNDPVKWRNVSWVWCLLTAYSHGHPHERPGPLLMSVIIALKPQWSFQGLRHTHVKVCVYSLMSLLLPMALRTDMWTHTPLLISPCPPSAIFFHHYPL